jgi:hypothetical protein
VLIVPGYEAAYGQKPVEQWLRGLAETEYGSLHLETRRVEHSGDMAMEIGQFSTMARQEWNEGAGTREVGERMAEVWGVGLIRADGWNRTLDVASDRAA